MIDVSGPAHLVLHLSPDSLQFNRLTPTHAPSRCAHMNSTEPPLYIDLRGTWKAVHMQLERKFIDTKMETCQKPYTLTLILETHSMFKVGTRSLLVHGTCADSVDCCSLAFRATGYLTCSSACRVTGRKVNSSTHTRIQLLAFL